MSVDASVLAPSRQHEWLPILELAVMEVFEIMLGSRLTLATKSEPPPQGELTAIVAMAGSLRGTVTFCCGSQSANQIAVRLLGAGIVPAEGQVWDAIGEICNMVAGHFKAKIGREADCMLSVPMVILGTDYQVHSVHDGEHLQVPVFFEGELLEIVLEIRK